MIEVKSLYAWLNKGDVWKYGETTSKDRYSQDYLRKEGVVFSPQFPGNQVEIKVAEKKMLKTGTNVNYRNVR